MTYAQLNALAAQCLRHENAATSPAQRRYWDAQFRRLRAAMRAAGWID